MARRFEEIVIPLLRGLDGFEGAIVLADRHRGTNIAVSFWASEAALQSSEADVRDSRAQAEAAAQARSPSVVEHLEVLLKV